ncbi:polyprenyl synthetase family protein [Pendulispora rubella]|uniref:Polyprenyl synthetase family protein n=1 Tax=Pendulispora rubella TaxID=2741070 RepID=A0ABZ2KR48_9BACT
MTTNLAELPLSDSAAPTGLDQASSQASSHLGAIVKHFPKWAEKAETLTSIGGAVRDEVHRHVDPRYENPLDRMVQYAVGAPGKMLRGLMLVESCRAVGGDPQKVLPAAAGTEFGHLASLIHDDVIDRDETRRGRTAIWRKYGVDNAILVGDLFIFYAYHSLAQCRKTVGAERVVRVLEVLSQACVELCRGQAHEAQLAGVCSVSREEYMHMVRGKTGSLFRVAAESGAILGGGTDEQVAAVRDYAEWLGIAYQIIDDLLSYCGDDAVLLKPAKSDIKNRRITLPVVYALEMGSTRQQDILRSAFEEYNADAETLAANYGKVREVLERTGAITRAKSVALDLLDQALLRIGTLPQSEGRTCLQMIAHMATHRSR